MRNITRTFVVACLVVLVGCSAGTTEPAIDNLTAVDQPLTTVSPSTTVPQAPETTITLLPGADPILGIVPPNPTDYPFIQFSYRYNEWVAECSAAAGFEMKVIDTATPHLSAVGPDSQRRQEVVDRCRVIVVKKGWAIPNPFDGSPEANAVLYDIYVDIQACLIEHNYPTTNLPSKEAFIEEGDALWIPWNAMFGSLIHADPDDPMPPNVRLQYEAQETCGGLPNEVYDQQLQEQG